MPAVGECRALTIEQWLASVDTSDPIDCATPHTGRVIATGILPDRVAYNLKQQSFYVEIAKICYPALVDALGSSEHAREMTTYQYAFWIPTVGERNHGARWIRCDVVLINNASLAKLPTDTVPMLSTPIPDSVARCLKAKTFYWTTCNKTHAFRATGTFIFRHDGYPTFRQFQRAAQRKCPSRVTSSQWRFGYIGETAWEIGRRRMLCYTKTTS
jgi:Septum formation